MSDYQTLRLRLPRGYLFQLESNLMDDKTVLGAKIWLGKILGYKPEDMIMSLNGTQELPDFSLLGTAIKNYDFDFVDVQINNEEFTEDASSLFVKIRWLSTDQQLCLRFLLTDDVSELKTRLSSLMSFNDLSKIRLYFRELQLKDNSMLLASIVKNETRDYILCVVGADYEIASFQEATVKPPAVDMDITPRLYFEFPKIKSTRHAIVRVYERLSTFLPDTDDVDELSSTEKEVEFDWVFDWSKSKLGVPLVGLTIEFSASLEFDKRYFVLVSRLQTTANRLTKPYRYHFKTKSRLLNFYIRVPGSDVRSISVDPKKYPNVDGLYHYLKDELELFENLEARILEVSSDTGVMRYLAGSTMLADISAPYLYVVPMIPLVLPLFDDELPEPGEDTCSICITNRPRVVTSCGHVFCRACAVRSFEKMHCFTCRAWIISVSQLFARIKQAEPSVANSSSSD